MTQAAEARPELRLEQLMKRLQVVLYLGHRNPESDFKLLELQELLAAWLRSRRGQGATDKVMDKVSQSS